jgi:hypothetical protein
LGFLNVSHLETLQNKLKAKGLKARSVNGIIHSCLRAMLRDARMDGLIKVNLYDRAFFKPLPITDGKPSIDPYTPEEREIILARSFPDQATALLPIRLLPVLAGNTPKRSHRTQARRCRFKIRHGGYSQNHCSGTSRRHENRQEQSRDPSPR